MKRKDFIELKSKSIKELTVLVSGKKAEAAKKKMESLAGKEKNLKSFKNLRSEIVKILTLIREKEILEKIKPQETKEIKKEIK